MPDSFLRKVAAHYGTEKPVVLEPANGHRPEPDHPLVRAALEKRLSELSATPVGSRNDALNTAAAYLGRFPIDRGQLRTMLLDACAANGLLEEDGHHACDGTISSGLRKADADGPRVIEERHNIITLDPITPNGDTPHTPTQKFFDGILKTENGFWDARPCLHTIYESALARMCAPWAVLAHCAARALTEIRPVINLPPLIGGNGSLNWFAAVAAPSGGGKGSAGSVARELVPQLIHQRNLGSGEGIIGAFYKPGSRGEPPEQHESVMFVADEIDTMHALGTRTGSTTMSVLRSGFSGETLGFSYIAKGRDVHLEAHTYRMTLVISVQPGRASALLDDCRGGTPQRFMWFPGIDSRITDDPADLFPHELTLPRAGEWQYPRILRIPAEAAALIRHERAKSGCGDTTAMNGHAMFVREKFAYALTVLDGRTEMTSEDWRLAGIASAVSCHTSAWVTQQLLTATEEDAVERGRLMGVTYSASDDEKAYRADQRSQRIARWVLRRLEENGPIGMSNRDLSRACAHRDRCWLDGALKALTTAGVISCEEGLWTRSS